MEEPAPLPVFVDARYEFNAPKWHAFPGPNEDGEASCDSDSVSQYFNDPKATAALLTPNARQNVVTVRRRTGPHGRSSGLISPQPLKAAKRLRMELADENAPPPGAAAKKQRAINIRTSWGGAATRRVHAASAASGRPATGAKAGPSGASAGPMSWPPPPKRDALRRMGSPRSRGAAAAAAAAGDVARPAAAAQAAAKTATPPAARAAEAGSTGRTRSQQQRSAAAAADAAHPAFPQAAADHPVRAAPAAEPAAVAAGNAPAEVPAPEQDAAAAAPTSAERPLKTPRRRKRSARADPWSAHRDFCHVTRSVAKTLSPAGVLEPASPPVPAQPVLASPHATAAPPAAAPGLVSAGKDMSERKRSLRAHAGGAAEPAADASSQAVAAPPAADTQGDTAAAPTAMPAASFDHGIGRGSCRSRPRKSGLHAAAASRVPRPAAAPPVSNLSASVIALNTAAALMSAEAAHRAAAATGSPLPATTQVPAAGAFRAAARKAAAAPQRRQQSRMAAVAESAAAAEAAPIAPSAQHQAAARLKALTVPHSPMLRSKLRHRPLHPILCTEELRLQQSRAEAEEAAQLRALNAAAAGRVLKHMPRLPPRQARKLTVAHTPALRTAKRPRIHDASAEVQARSIAEQLADFEAGRGPVGAAWPATLARGSVGPHRLTQAQSPALHTISRARPPRFVSTEEAEAAALAALPPFAARPVSRAVMESDGASGLPHVPPRQPTEFAPFHLSETNAPPPAPAAEEQAFHFTARPAPPSTWQAAPAPAPLKALLTQLQPFELRSDTRGPHRAAALAAEKAARAALTSSRASSRASSGNARQLQPPKPPTKAASPRLAGKARAADRARFDEQTVERAAEEEAQRKAAAAAQAERDAAELAAHRAGLQFKARPMPTASKRLSGPGPVPPQPLTVPQSPFLNTRSRATARGW